MPANVSKLLLDERINSVDPDEMPCSAAAEYTISKSCLSEYLLE